MWFCKIILLCLLLLRPALSGGELYVFTLLRTVLLLINPIFCSDEVDSHKTTYARDFSYINIRDSNRCSVEFELMSTTEIQSSAYSTPIVFPFHRDGKKQVCLCVSSPFLDFNQYYLQIHRNDRTWWHNSFWYFLISHINFSVGWPLGYDDSHYDISPIPFDCDNDGIDDLLLINYDGLIRCVKACDYDILSFFRSTIRIITSTNSIWTSPSFLSTPNCTLFLSLYNP